MMRLRRPMPDVARGLLGAVLLCMTLACSPGEERVPRVVDSPAARELVGAWDVTFIANTLATSLARSARDSVTRGVLTFALTTHGAPSMYGLRGVTHIGVYDVDFSRLGFAPAGAGGVTTSVARVGAAGDSVHMVLSPDADRFSVRMEGVLADGRGSGTWSATAFSAGGGMGRFVMRRHVSGP